jgi:hypothetical protein
MYVYICIYMRTYIHKLTDIYTYAYAYAHTGDFWRAKHVRGCYT